MCACWYLRDESMWVLSYQGHRPLRSHVAQCLLCGRLLRFFLTAPRPSADHFAVNRDFDFEQLIVIGPRLANDGIGGKRVEPSLAPFLNLRFVIVFTRLM